MLDALIVLWLAARGFYLQGLNELWNTVDVHCISFESDDMPTDKPEKK